jgi:hypothetical protein
MFGKSGDRGGAVGEGEDFVPFPAKQLADRLYHGQLVIH